MEVMQELDKRIEAILFFENQPVSIKKLSTLFKVSSDDIKNSLEILNDRLQGGIVLIQKDDEVMLGTSPEVSEIIESIKKEELSKELSKAALETLTIIIYKGPLRRSEIDFIRGVNSQFIIRNLEMRGLVERITDPKDERASLYRPSFELLSFLGIKNIEDMPEFDVLKKKVEDLEESLKQTEENQ